MGGIDYSGGCVVSKINGGFRNGGYTLRLKPGENHIDGKQALALARTRKNLCNPREDDLARIRRQQKLFAAMKSRLLSPCAFVRLPLISWNAPKAIRSDMSGPTLLGTFAAIATTGTPETRVLKPDGRVTLPNGGDALVGLRGRAPARGRPVPGRVGRVGGTTQPKELPCARHYSGLSQVPSFWSQPPGAARPRAPHPQWP